ncbi:GntR family transcriptional regulator [Acuticoccus kandeliae]|uniref:GntR family transcriptional regulator n=1 Tax=Acuticoccus kandeliae TaxID=2073160 RepID=UPI000D3ED31C|nr:GntR family transcriptional regulator [Acuticoccus kandeliae]
MTETEPASAVDRAYRTIKTAILSNELQAGRSISDQRIAVELGISRTPVREALHLLQHEGYVIISPRRGVNVLAISLDDLTRIYEVITALELYAIRVAGRRGPAPGAVEDMLAACAGMNAALAEGEMTRWSSCDEAFHRALLRSSGNDVIVSQGIHHWERVSRAHRVALRLRDKPRLSTDAHSEVAELMAAGRFDAAVERHCQQRERSGQELIDAIARVGLTEL